MVQLGLSAHSERTITGRPRVSLLVPVYNEEDTIKPFLETIKPVLEGVDDTDFEILFVNDGSRDATEVAVRMSECDFADLKLINFSRNFGKEAAVAAGLSYAKGDAVIPIDVDLQDAPELIPDMIQLWKDGAMVVNAQREDRSSDTFLKRVTANGFYKVFNFLADHPIPVNVGDFRLIDRKVVDILNQLGERARVNKSLFSWVGFNAATVTFKREERTAGQTSWSFWKLWNFALDGIFSSSTVPLRVWSYIGALMALVAFSYAGFIFLRSLIMGVDVPGYSSLIMAVLLFGGLNLLCFGLLGEYIGRIYTEVRGRPLYIVESVYSDDDTTS